MEVGDKSWMNLQRSTNENIHGVNGFLDKAFERAFQGHGLFMDTRNGFSTDKGFPQ